MIRKPKRTAPRYKVRALELFKDRRFGPRVVASKKTYNRKRKTDNE